MESEIEIKLETLESLQQSGLEQMDELINDEIEDNQSQNIAPEDDRGQGFPQDKGSTGHLFCNVNGAAIAAQSSATSYKCPYDGCDVTVAEFSILRHLHKFHPNSVEEVVIRQSLQDKAPGAGVGDILNTLDTVKRMMQSEGGDPVASNSCQEVKIEAGSCPSSPEIVAVSSASKAVVVSSNSRVAADSRSSISAYNRGRLQYFTRGRNGRAQKRYACPKPALIRAVLQNFTVGSGFYCPECRSGTRKTMPSTWSVQRHLTIYHPDSEILRNPDSVKLKVLQYTGREANGVDQTYSNQLRMEQVQENHANEIDDSDFITISSSPGTLSAFRQCLRQYRLYPQIPHNYSSSCPICKDRNDNSTFCNSTNLSLHILKVHPGCDLLRKSNLGNFTPHKRTKKAKMKLTKLRQAIRITKMKIRAISSTRGGVGGPRKGGKLPSPLTVELKKCKTNCGTGFYCPDCATLGTERIFSIVPNVVRHMITHHPDSELLLFYQRRKNRGHKKSSGDKVDVPGCQSDIQLNSTTSMDPVVEEIPGIQPQTEEDSGFITISSSSEILARFRRFLRRYRLFPEIPKNYMTFCPLCQEGGCSPSFTRIFNLSLHILKVHPGCELLRMSNLDGVVDERLGRPLGRKNNPVFSGQAKVPGPLCRELMKYKTSCGTRFYCPDCSSLGTVQIFRVVSKLVRHLRMHHPDSELFKLPNESHIRDNGAEIEASQNSEDNNALGPIEDVEANNLANILCQPSSSKSTYEPSQPISCKSYNSVSWSSLDFNGVEEIQAKIWAEISNICSSTDPNRIQCPLCPDAVKKPVYQSWHYLFLHFERSCLTWKTLHPEFSHVYLSQRRWSCGWCARPAFWQQQSLTEHVTKEHTQISPAAIEAHVEMIRRTLYTCHWCREDCQDSNGLKAHCCTSPSKVENKDNIVLKRLDNQFELLSQNEMVLPNYSGVSFESTEVFEDTLGSV